MVLLDNLGPKTDTKDVYNWSRASFVVPNLVGDTKLAVFRIFTVLQRAHDTSEHYSQISLITMCSTPLAVLSYVCEVNGNLAKNGRDITLDTKLDFEVSFILNFESTPTA